MANLTLAQLQSLATSVGFPDPDLAAAVAMAESGGNPCAQGDPNIGSSSCTTPNGTSTSFGLWQVNTPANPQYDQASLLNAQYNARAALAISRNGTYWTPWTTFRTGAYQKWYHSGVIPPGGGPMIVPSPVTPPTSGKSAVALGVASVLAVVAVAGLFVFRAAKASNPLPPPPRPDYPPVFRYRPVPFRPEL